VIKENKLALARAEMTMVRLTCVVCQIDRCSSVVPRDRFGLEEDSVSMLRCNRLR